MRRFLSGSVGILAFSLANRHISTMECRNFPWRWTPLTLAALGLLAACEPTVKLAAPDKPIVINLNVKIEREVRVKVEREIEDVIRENKEIF